MQAERQGEGGVSVEDMRSDRIAKAEEAGAKAEKDAAKAKADAKK